MKRILVVLLIVVFAMSIFIGCKSEDKDTKTEDKKTDEKQDEKKAGITFPLANKITIKLLNREHPTVGKYSDGDDGNVSYTWVEEKTNIALDLDQIPFDSWDQKIQVLLGTGDIPDGLMPYNIGLKDPKIDQLFVNLLDYADYAPNFVNMLKTDEDFVKKVASSLLVGENIYTFGQFEKDNRPFVTSFMYRKDLFDRDNKLKYGTWEELYESMKVLKGQYPESFPFGAIQGMAFTQLASYFGASGPAGPVGSSTPVVYYNMNDDEWKIQGYQEEFKYMIKWLAKLNENKLLHPEFFTATFNQYKQQWARSEVFVAPWWSTTARRFEQDVGPENHGKLTAEGKWNGEGFWTDYMPIPEIDANQKPPALRNLATFGMYVEAPLVNLKSKYIKEFVALMDFTYDKEVSLVCSYGPPGLMWDYNNEGKPRFIPEIKTGYNPDGEQLYYEYASANEIKYGYYFGRTFSYGPDLYEATGAFNEPDQIHMFGQADIYKDNIVNKLLPVVVLTPEEQEELASTLTAVSTYFEEECTKFVLGKRPIEEWDDFKAKLKELGAEKILKLYQDNSEMPNTEFLKDWAKEH